MISDRNKQGLAKLRELAEKCGPTPKGMLAVGRDLMDTKYKVGDEIYIARDSWCHSRIGKTEKVVRVYPKCGDAKEHYITESHYAIPLDDIETDEERNVRFGKINEEALKSGKGLAAWGYVWFLLDGEIYAHSKVTSQAPFRVHGLTAEKSFKADYYKVVELSELVKSFIQERTKPKNVEIKTEALDALIKERDFHKKEAEGLCKLKHEVREALGVPDGKSLVEHAKELKAKADSMDKVRELVAKSTFVSDVVVPAPKKPELPEKYRGKVTPDVANQALLEGFTVSGFGSVRRLRGGQVEYFHEDGTWFRTKEKVPVTSMNAHGFYYTVLIPT